MSEQIRQKSAKSILLAEDDPDDRMLVVEAFEAEIPKGYIYFAMAFSVFVEMLNIRYRKNRPVDLHGVSLDDAAEAPAGSE